SFGFFARIAIASSTGMRTTPASLSTHSYLATGDLPASRGGRPSKPSNRGGGGGGRFWLSTRGDDGRLLSLSLAAKASNNHPRAMWMSNPEPTSPTPKSRTPRALTSRGSCRTCSFRGCSECGISAIGDCLRNVRVVDRQQRHLFELPQKPSKPNSPHA